MGATDKLADGEGGGGFRRTEGWGRMIYWQSHSINTSLQYITNLIKSRNVQKFKFYWCDTNT